MRFRHRTIPLAVAVAAVATALTSVASAPVAAEQPAAEPAQTVTPVVQPLAASSSLAYTPITPKRILDTRERLGADLPDLPVPPLSDFGDHPCQPGETDVTGTGIAIIGGEVVFIDFCSDRDENALPSGPPPLQAGKSLTLDVAAGLGRESGEIAAVVMNVTVTEATAPSFLTAWPSGEDRPNASNLNFVGGQTVANLVTVKVGRRGAVDIFNSAGTTHVIADVVGYHAPTSDFVGLTPSRILDTREGIGAPSAKVGGDRSIDLQVTGRGGVPSSGVSAVVMNVTATNPTLPSFATVYPTGEARPDASNLNFNAGASVPNLVTTKLGAGGNVTLYNRQGTVDLIADVVGYYKADATYVPLSPDRILDTRKGIGAPRRIVGAGGDVSLDVLGVGGVPDSGVRAVVMNVTATESTAPSFITVWPDGETRPDASSINLVPGKSVPNLVVAKVGSGGRVRLFNGAGATHIIADVVGYIDATAGVDLPVGLNTDAEATWSTSTWSVRSIELTENTDDGRLFAPSTTPFFLDINLRYSNRSEHESQQFAFDELISLVTDDGPLELLATPFVNAGARRSDDFTLSAALDWGADLSGLDVVFGGTTLVPGRLGLTGSPVNDRQVPIGGTIAVTTPPNGLCTPRNFNGFQSGEVDITARLAVWATSVPAEVNLSGPTTLVADAGHRWLVLDLELDGRDCFSANIRTSEFALEVDGSFVVNETFVNALVQSGTDTALLAYQVPIGAQRVELSIGKTDDQAVTIDIPTTNLR